MTEMDKAILVPAAVLVVWTMVMLLWMAADRVRVFTRHDINLAKAPPGARGADLSTMLPPGADWPAHNYMHLMEQPTVFYPTVLLLALGGFTGVDLVLAWLYVGLRIAHSLWQGLVNTLPVRAALFFAASLALLILAIRALMAVIW
jgi:hypothetical protein